ncbi:hypothetical protein BH20ACI4_BH20ACI4_26040 [soil metagenome]
MSFDPNFDIVVRNFVANFNQMCRATNRDYLIRTDNPKAESPKEKTYAVEYKFENLGFEYNVYAEWRKWYFFSKKIPFMQIGETRNNQIKLTGMFTENMPVINRDPVQLQHLLQHYLVHCRNIPGASFVRV